MRSKKLSTIDQRELALSRKADRTDVPLDLIAKQATMMGAISLCVQLSGLEEKEIYLSLGIDAGHWTRIMKGESEKGSAHFPPNKLNALMDITGNNAPLLWAANARGYGLVLLKSEAEKRAEEAERRADEAEIKLRLLTDIMKGK